MAVHPHELEIPERDLDLTTRRSAPAVEEDAPEEGPVAPGATLGDRIAAAKALVPPDVACRACWAHGRDAALRAVTGAGIEAARGVIPGGSELHWRASWIQGRDAAVAVVEGR